MKIRINHGPRFGQECHVERNQTTSLLLALNLIEEIVQVPTPVQPTEPCWSVQLGPHCGYFIQLVEGASVRYFHGDPDQAAHAFQHRDWQGSVTGPIAPTHIVEQYRAALESAGKGLRTVNDRGEIEAAMEAQKYARRW